MDREIKELILDKRLVKEFANSRVTIIIDNDKKRIVICGKKFSWIISQFYKMFRWGE